jgi:hypothetical protein
MKRADGAISRRKLLLFGGHPLDLAGAPGLLDIRVDLCSALRSREHVGQLVLRRDDHEGHPKDSIGTGREEGHWVPLLRSKDDLGPLASTDPVLLHQLDPRGPVDLLEIVEQLIGLRGDSEEPGRNLLLQDTRMVAPTIQFAVSARMDFLIGERGLADRAPPLPVRGSISQAALIQEQNVVSSPLIVDKMARPGSSYRRGWLADDRGKLPQGHPTPHAQAR